MGAAVITAVVLIFVKTGAWLSTGSVSLLASLIDSLMDAAASVINLLAVRVPKGVLAYRVYLFALVGLTLVVWVSDAIDGVIGDQGVDTSELLTDAVGAGVVALNDFDLVVWSTLHVRGEQGDRVAAARRRPGRAQPGRAAADHQPVEVRVGHDEVPSVGLGPQSIATSASA